MSRKPRPHRALRRSRCMQSTSETPSVSRLRVPSLAEPRIVGTRSVCSNVTIGEAATSARTRSSSGLEAFVYGGARYMKKWSTPRRLWWASHGSTCSASYRGDHREQTATLCTSLGGACRSSSTSSAESSTPRSGAAESASAMRCALPSTHGGRPRRFGCSVYHEVTCADVGVNVKTAALHPPLRL